jgi:hypothetical protein
VPVGRGCSKCRKVPAKVPESAETVGRPRTDDTRSGQDYRVEWWAWGPTTCYDDEEASRLWGVFWVWRRAAKLIAVLFRAWRTSSAVEVAQGEAAEVPSGRAGLGAAAMSPQAVLVHGVVFALLAGILPGCSVSPAEQDAIRRAWAERDAERAQECHRHNLGFVAGGCASPGGP